MSRRRYISTDISLDKRVNALSDFAMLLYTWMIPHAEDDGTLTADRDELAWTVLPAQQRKTPKISAALDEMFESDLLILSCGKLWFPFESFYRYQTYIPPAKRRDFDPSTEHQRKTPRITVSPSPSLSPSLSPSPSLSLADASAFDEWWKTYPKKVKKGCARECYVKALAKVDSTRLLVSLAAQLPHWRETEAQYIPHPSTWLNEERWEDEFPAQVRGVSVSSADAAGRSRNGEF